MDTGGVPVGGVGVDEMAGVVGGVGVDEMAGVAGGVCVVGWPRLGCNADWFA